MDERLDIVRRKSDSGRSSRSSWARLFLNPPIPRDPRRHVRKYRYTMKQETKAAQKAIVSARARAETVYTYLMMGLVDESTYEITIGSVWMAQAAVEASEVAVKVTETILADATTVKSTRLAATDLADARAAKATADEVLASAFTWLRMVEWIYRDMLIGRLAGLLQVASRR